MPLDEFAKKNIYEPLGMRDTGFRPARELLSRVAPTETVRGMRSYLGGTGASGTDAERVLRGEVHDPTSNRMGGVAGHAGLFSTADDLAIFCQMILNGGEYDGVRILSPLGVEAMTRPRQVTDEGHARGIGWDLTSSFSANRGDLFPAGSFGHTGFTGTSIWIDPAQDVFPVDDIFDPQVTQEQVAEENAIQMEGSQEEATAVALRAIGKDVPTHIAIASITDSSKAKGLLKVRDRLESIDDEPVTTAQSVRDALQKSSPGDTVSLIVTRDGKEVTVEVPTVAGQGGRTALGVLLGLDHDFTAQVTIDAGTIGGPSAGLMFSLGIFDKVTNGALTGGQNIAGTGTIDGSGKVGPIGGIRQKLVGAKQGGANYFLAPADNCDEVRGAVPDGLQAVRVATFADAKAAVDKIAAGTPQGLPAC
jgi:PDZ domain-containing secreted protein